MSRATSVLTTADRGVLTIVLNRPDVRNAVDQGLADGLAAALDALDASDDLHVAVLTGADGTFCSGLDLKAFAAGAPAPRAGGRGFAGIVERPPHKPLIAAIEGHALAGGLEIALACDLIVAAEDAQLGLPEVKRGLVARGGGLIRLPPRIGRSSTLRLALTGEIVDGREALRLGLADRLAAPGTALAEALSLAAEITTAAPLAVRTTKEIVGQVQGASEPDAWALQQPLAHAVFESRDAAEGARAFAEKRAPVWEAR
jgi:enoyl-CoA hydratase